MVKLEIDVFSPVCEIIFGNYNFPLLRFDAGSLIVYDDSGLSYYNTNMFIVSYSCNTCKINNDYEMVNFKNDTNSSERKISISNLNEISIFGKLVKQFIKLNSTDKSKTTGVFKELEVKVKTRKLENEIKVSSSVFDELVIDIYKANLMNLIDKSLDERNEILFMQLTNDLALLNENI